jgi:hypothetical protein
MGEDISEQICYGPWIRWRSPETPEAEGLPEEKERKPN